MPAMYLAIKAKLKKQGKSESAAESEAVKTYNARRPAGAPPVTKNYEEQIKHGRTKKRPDRGDYASEY